MRALAILALLSPSFSRAQDLGEPTPPPTLPPLVAPVEAPARLAGESDGPGEPSYSRFTHETQPWPAGLIGVSFGLPATAAAAGTTEPASGASTSPRAAGSSGSTSATTASIVDRALAVETAPAMADPLISCDELCDCCICKLPSRWSVRHDVGDGVGFTSGFTYLEGFVPLWEPGPTSVIYGDARIVNFDDARRWEFNGGGGWRTCAPGADAVLGLNLFYDCRHTDANFFHQIGLGGEILFPRCDLRANGYFIVGPSEKVAAEGPSTASTVGDQLIVSRLLTYDVAMSGVDYEAGTMLPAVGPVAPRVFLGGYHYSAEHVPAVNGIRGRLEAWIGRHVTLYCAVQHDEVFQTTVSGGVALHLGGGQAPRTGRDCEDPPRSVDERLAERVVRDVNIVVVQRTELQTFVPDPPGLRDERNGNGDGVPPASGNGEGPPPPGSGQGTPPPGSSGGTPPPGSSGGTPPPSGNGQGPPPSCSHPHCDSCPCTCRPFPGRPGDPDTFPGHKFPPGFHHPCFPGRGHGSDCHCDDHGHDDHDHGHGHEHDCKDDDHGD